jgi:hypothetical protein
MPEFDNTKDMVDWLTEHWRWRDRLAVRLWMRWYRWTRWARR